MTLPIRLLRIIEKLGAGGMGEVYEAEDLKRGRIPFPSVSMRARLAMN